MFSCCWVMCAHLGPGPAIWWGRGGDFRMSCARVRTTRGLRVGLVCSNALIIWAEAELSLLEGEGATAGMILPFHTHACISQCISPSAFLWQWQLGAEEVRGNRIENGQREEENGKEEERMVEGRKPRGNVDFRYWLKTYSSVEGFQRETIIKEQQIKWYCLCTSACSHMSELTENGCKKEGGYLTQKEAGLSLLWPSWLQEDPSEEDYSAPREDDALTPGLWRPLSWSSLLLQHQCEESGGLSCVSVGARQGQE